MNFRTIVAVALFNAACATTQMPTATPSGANLSYAVADGFPDRDITVDTDGRSRARQADIRQQYHTAFDESSVVLVDLMEGGALPDFWRVELNFLPPDHEGPQLNVDCRLNGLGMPGCAVVAPPRYQSFSLSIQRDGGSQRIRFWGRLRVRRMNQTSVEYRPFSYNEHTGTTDLEPVTP
ncbi:hypothetical protein KBD34_02550 [Patescibacteria group bacterium]|nr:hypothetical protein [Patescibacteria group bacterium]